MDEFNKEGFPIIKLKDNCFEIKAIDYSEFRTFNYSEIVDINYFNDSGDFWFWPILSILESIYGTYKLKVIKKNGADWIYKTPSKYNKEFASVVQEIITRSSIERKINSY